MPLCPQITMTPVPVTSSGITMGWVKPASFPNTMTASSLISTLYSSTAPIAYTIGQLWADASTGNKLYRCFTVATVINAVGNGTTVTYTTDTDHGLTAGDLITIDEIDPTAYNLTAKTVASAPTTTTFTVTSTATGTYVDGGWVAGWKAIQDTAIDAAATLAASKAKTFRQTSTPTTGMQIGDIWFDTDDGNKQYRYESTGWVSVQDGAIANAQASADGKNTIFYQASAPTALAVGDIWFDTDDGYKHYRWNGASWTAFELGNAAIASISASKLTAGTIDASVITVSNINAGNITTGTISGIAYNNGSGTFQVTAAGALTAASATITGAVTATSGKIGNFTITSGDYLVYGSTKLFGASSSGSYCLEDTSRGIYTKEIILSGTASTTISATAGTIGTLYTDTIGNTTMTIAATTLYGNSTLYGAGIAGRAIHMRGSANSYDIACTTSTRRNKQDEAPMDWDATPLLNIEMKKFRLKKEVAELGEAAPYHYGLMAEDVADAGLEWLIDRDEENRPDYIYWSERVPQALLALIQQQATTIASLEARITALEGN